VKDNKMSIRDELTEINIKQTLPEDIQTLEEWEEKQDFEYRRVESKAIDYANTVIDFENLNKQITEKQTSKTSGFNNLFREASIDPQSAEANGIKRHIEGYVDANVR
jgi:hypothetical protein